MPRRNVPVKKDNTNAIIIGGGVAAVIIVLILVVANSLVGTSTPQTTSATRDWGSSGSPITVVEYSDLQ